MPTDDFFYRQKQGASATSTLSTVSKIPEWLEPGMIVTLSTYSLMVGFVYKEAKQENPQNGTKNYQSNQEMTVMVTRVDPIFLRKWFEFIWQDEVFRIETQSGLTVQKAIEPPDEPESASEDPWWSDAFDE